MKTPKEILHDQPNYSLGLLDLAVRQAIEQAQTDAYSQAVKDAAEKASNYVIHCVSDGDMYAGEIEQSILKLLKI